MAGFIYIFSNPAYGTRLKIGKSAKDPEEDRLSELYTTSAPEPFVCEYWAFVDRYDEIERRVHIALSAYRVNPQREFFDVGIVEAIEAIKLAVASLKPEVPSRTPPQIHFEKPLHEWREAVRRAEEERAARLAEERRHEEEERQRAAEERRKLEEAARLAEQRKAEQLAQELKKREEERLQREEATRIAEQREAEQLAEALKKKEEERLRRQEAIKLAERQEAERLAEERRLKEEERRLLEEQKVREARYVECLQIWKKQEKRLRRSLDLEIRRNDRIWRGMIKQLGLAYGGFSYPIADKKILEKAEFEKGLRAAAVPQISGFSSCFAEINSAADSDEDSRAMFLSVFAIELQQCIREALAEHFFNTTLFEKVPYWAEVRNETAFGPAVWRPNKHGSIRQGEFIPISNIGSNVVQGKTEIDEFFSVLRQQI